ncbi:MAG: aminopeptidase [Candidatus Eremiobacteraeota bacterium]|nr:aminopeptidase [Candidatus Eremiobacteraeota bacterium]
MHRSFSAFALVAAAVLLATPSVKADTSPPNLQQLAQKIITTSVAVQPGEVVVIEGGKHTIPFMEDLAIQAQLAGGLVTIWLDSDKVIRSQYVDVPEKYLSIKPEYQVPWFKAIDVYINLPNTSDIAALDAGVSAKRLGDLNAAGAFLAPLADAMKFRSLAITYPTDQRGASFKLSGPTYVNMIWAAMGADYTKIAADGAKLKEKIMNAKSVRITSPAGTDFTFKLTGREPNLSDGVITSAEAKGHKLVDRSAQLPDGQVTALAQEDSAAGRVDVPAVLCRFEVMKNVSFTFKDGTATGLQAASGSDCFHQLVAASGGPTMKLGSFSIGLNPAWAIHDENGAAYFPTPGAGIVYVNIGDNTFLGGSVKTIGNFNFGFPIKNATVYLDGVKVVDGGKVVE